MEHLLTTVDPIPEVGQKQVSPLEFLPLLSWPELPHPPGQDLDLFSLNFMLFLSQVIRTTP